ncbi:VOC family protein [Phenylobacterium sp.]|uniref:VOC family protein n=1 Tax=Phenylobacterium sp. TaxID=1871053 RepID=UPI002E332D99|nr:VOC family protein [Phenylobacterium sp.]
MLAVGFIQFSAGRAEPRMASAAHLKPLLEAPGETPKGSTMSTVTFAKHSKLTVKPSDQPAVRKFYREVLGVPQVRESQTADIFRLGPEFFMGVIYTPDAPTAEAMQDAIWLELATADPAAMKAKILAGGGKEIEYRDRDHFYFQAPGGQVFRLISDVEDMSAWER